MKNALETMKPLLVLLVSIPGLCVACAPIARTAPPLVTPVADVRQIMFGLTTPASEVVFKAVSTTTTSRGREERVPKTDEEWEAIENSAAVLAESGNLLMTGNRIRDQGDWIEMSQALVDASRAAMEAAQRKNLDALTSSFDPIYVACERCHLKYFK